MAAVVVSVTVMMVVVMVTAGVRGAVVVGIARAVARSSRVMPRRFCDDNYPGVNDSWNPAKTCENDIK